MEAVVCSVSTGLRQNRGSFYSPGVGSAEKPLPRAAVLLPGGYAFSPGIILEGTMKVGKDKNGERRINEEAPGNDFKRLFYSDEDCLVPGCRNDEVEGHACW